MAKTYIIALLRNTEYLLLEFKKNTKCVNALLCMVSCNSVVLLVTAELD